MLKLNNNEKLTENDIEEIKELQKKIDVLLDGDFIHNPRKKSDTSD